jgi:hypothetical protein
LGLLTFTLHRCAYCTQASALFGETAANCLPAVTRALQQAASAFLASGPCNRLWKKKDGQSIRIQTTRMDKKHPQDIQN